MKMRIWFLPMFILAGALSKARAQELPSARMESAARFEGATWAEQVNAAVAALPATGGIIDAQELCLRRALAVADTNIVLGSNQKTVRLELGSCTYPLGAHRILYFSNTEVGGMGMSVPTGTTMTYTGSGAGFSYGGPLHSTVVYAVFMHDFAITGDGTLGSVGIDMTYALTSTLERIRTGGSDNGWKFGGSPTCSCYNQIIQVFAFDRSRGGWLSKTANQNQIFGGAVRANKFTGIGLDIDGAGANQIYSLDIESSAKFAIKFEKNVYGANGNAVVNPYLEAVGPILIDSGSTYNSIVGTGGLFERGSVVDRSGNMTNYVHQTGGGGGTDGIWPYYEVVQDGIFFGISPHNSLKALSDGTGVRDALHLRWDGGFAPTYGVFGHAPLEVGEAILHSGANITGLMTTTRIADLAAPTVSPIGTFGKTTYRYYLVCHDRNGGVTQPSPAGSISTGNSVLSAVNYNEISWPPVDGCWSWDILKGDTEMALITGQQPSLRGSANPTIIFKDIGQATSPYPLRTRNTSGDFRLAGMMISTGIAWPLPASVVNGGSFYCPNCDPPMTPPTECTSSGARTGSWVHGLNKRWICAP